MATPPDTYSSKQTATEKAAARIQTYAELVSPAVGAAKNGLKQQLEEGAKNRLTFNPK